MQKCRSRCYAVALSRASWNERVRARRSSSLTSYVTLPCPVRRDATAAAFGSRDTLRTRPTENWCVLSRFTMVNVVPVGVVQVGNRFRVLGWCARDHGRWHGRRYRALGVSTYSKATGTCRTSSSLVNTQDTGNPAVNVALNAPTHL